MKYTIKEIREAVDIVIGDDGFRGKEVIKVLKLVHESKLTEEVTDEKN